VPAYGTVVKTSTVTSTSPAAALVNTTVGAVNVLVISANSTGTGVQPQIQTPSGWTLACPVAWKSGSPSHEIAVVYRKVQSGDTATSQAVSIAAAGGGNIAVAPLAFAPGELDSATIIVSGEALAANVAGPTTNVGPSVPLAGLRYVVTGFGNRSGATWSTASDGNVHDPIQLQGAQSGGASIAVCCTSSTTGSGAARSLLSSASTSINDAVIVAFNPAASGFSGAVSLTVGSALAATGGSAGSIALTAGSSLAAVGAPAASGQPALTAGVSLASALPAVAFLQSGVTAWVAHRNGQSTVYGECTLAGYQASARQYSRALLEIPVWASSDGVYYCLHDRTTGSRSQYTGPNGSVDVTATSSTILDQYTSVVGGYPLARLTDVLDTLRGRLFVVENKQGVNQATLSTLLDSHAGVGYWIFKGPYNDTANALTAAGHGAPMWLYFYPSNEGSLSSTWSAVSGAGVPVLYGLGDYSVTGADLPVQSDANTFFTFTAAHSIQSWAFIPGTSAQKTAADLQAATAGASFAGYMANSFATLAPNDDTTVSLPVGSTLSMGGAPAPAGAVAVSTGPALSMAGALSAVGAVPLSTGVVLVVSGAPAVAVPLSLAAGTALTVLGAAAVTGAPALAVGGVLSASGAPAATGAAAVAVGALLAAGGSPDTAGQLAVSAGVALALSAAAGAGGTVAVSTGAALVVGSATAGSAAVDVTAGVALGVAGATGVAAVVDLRTAVLLGALGATSAAGDVGLAAGVVLAVAGGPDAGGTAGLSVGVILAAVGGSPPLVVMFDGSLLGWRPGPARWGVREGVQAWAVAAGLARWLWRALGDGVKVQDRRLVNLQVRSPRPLTDDGVTVTACVSPTRTVPDAPTEQPVVIPDDYAWTGPADWATVAAWVGPGLPVGTNYVLTHVTAGGEDFWDVAASVQVEE